MLFQIPVTPDLPTYILENIPAFQNPWLQSAAILLGFLVLAVIFTFLTTRVVPIFTGRTSTTIDDQIIAHSKKPVFWLIILVGLWTAGKPIGMFEAVTRLILSGAAVLFLYFLGGIVNILISSWGATLARQTKTDIDEALLPLFTKAVNIFFVVLSAIWVLSIWNIDVTPWIAGLGVSGVVLGFALQDSLKNIFGGISLILDRTISVRDLVKLPGGQTGEVVEIGLRSTKLKTWDNELLTIPNGELANAQVQNYGQPNPKLRVVIKFGVEYGVEIDKVKKAVLSAIKNVKDISKDPAPDVIFTEMGDYALHFKTRFWVDNYKDAYGKKLEATEVIYNALNKAKIGIPFPTQMIYHKMVRKAP